MQDREKQKQAAGEKKYEINHLNLQTKQKTRLSALIWKLYHKNNKSKKHYLYANSWAIHCSQVTPGLLSRLTTGNASEKSSKGYFILMFVLKQKIAILLSLLPDNRHFS